MHIEMLYIKNGAFFSFQSKRDLITGLKTRTNAGRPNWDKVFKQIAQQKKGKVKEPDLPMAVPWSSNGTVSVWAVRSNPAWVQDGSVKKDVSF
jgi:hypothetical protein